MDKHRIFAENLDTIRKTRSLSMTEFSNEIGIPKSTLQSVLADGQTTLNTAIRISDQLGIPLDVLLSENMDAKKLVLTKSLLGGVTWFAALSEEDQKKVLFHTRKILEVLRK